MKTTPPAQHPLAGSSPVHTRIRGYSSPIAAPGNQRRRAAQRAPTWDAQPAFLCFSLPGQGDWQFPALTTRRTLSFLVITKVPGLWTILWPRDQWCDTAKGSGACESLGQTRHSRYTAYPPAGPRLHVSLLAARARAAQGLPPLRLELPKVTTPRNPASRVCFVCEEGTKHRVVGRGSLIFARQTSIMHVEAMVRRRCVLIVILNVRHSVSLCLHYYCVLRNITFRA